MAFALPNSTNVYIDGYSAKPTPKLELTDQQVDILFQLPEDERWLVSVELAVLGYAVPLRRGSSPLLEFASRTESR